RVVVAGGHVGRVGGDGAPHRGAARAEAEGVGRVGRGARRDERARGGDERGEPAADQNVTPARRPAATTTPLTSARLVTGPAGVSLASDVTVRPRSACHWAKRSIVIGGSGSRSSTP